MNYTVNFAPCSAVEFILNEFINTKEKENEHLLALKALVKDSRNFFLVEQASLHSLNIGPI